ncbi:MAG: HD domain-containing protein, partial [Actinomycetota bacterium]|nr:HD domain-containing protein [Actinomycetota bacterium]
AIPEAILQKPGPLTDDEWRFMKEHTVIGERILSAVPALQRIARNVRSSHERWDGRGYPDNLAAEEIPLAARITLACDAYDCIVSGRAYRPPRSQDEAVGELLRNAGAQFDPDVVSALVDVLDSGRLEAPGDHEQDIERDITRRLLAALRSDDRVPAGAAVAVAASARRA